MGQGLDHQGLQVTRTLEHRDAVDEQTHGSGVQGVQQALGAGDFASRDRVGIHHQHHLAGHADEQLGIGAQQQRRQVAQHMVMGGGPAGQGLLQHVQPLQALAGQLADADHVDLGVAPGARAGQPVQRAGAGQVVGQAGAVTRGGWRGHGVGVDHQHPGAQLPQHPGHVHHAGGDTRARLHGGERHHARPATAAVAHQRGCEAPRLLGGQPGAGHAVLLHLPAGRRDAQQLLGVVDGADAAVQQVQHRGRGQAGQQGRQQHGQQHLLVADALRRDGRQRWRDNAHEAQRLRFHVQVAQAVTHAGQLGVALLDGVGQAHGLLEITREVGGLPFQRGQRGQGVGLHLRAVGHAGDQPCPHAVGSTAVEVGFLGADALAQLAQFHPGGLAGGVLVFQAGHLA